MTFVMNLSLIFPLILASFILFVRADNDKVYDTVVLGAGFAGLSAALKLKETNYEYMVLEARDRIGGRAFTSYEFGDTIPQDMGGYYLTSSDNNPLWTFLDQETDINSTKQVLDALVMSSNGTVLNDEFDVMLKELWYPFIGEDGNDTSYYSSYYYESLKKIDFTENTYYYYENLKNGIEDVSVQYVIDNYITSSNITGLNLTLFMIQVERYFTSDFAGNTTELSSIGVHNMEFYKGASFYAYRRTIKSDRVNIKRGLSSLAEEYAKPVIDKVQLKSVVKSINYTLSPVEIVYELDGKKTVVKAETVIVTVPVGVLKAGK